MSRSLIVATAEGGVIGHKGEMPWTLPADLAYFKKITMGSAIIMGRKTFESIGRPLPKRLNVVVSRNTSLEIPGCTVCAGLNEAFKEAERAGKDSFIIGGGELYSQSLASVDRIYRTLVHGTCEGDTFFPALGDEWVLERREDHLRDDRNSHDYSFCVYGRSA